MMRGLLMDHPLIVQYAEEPAIAFAWCAEVAQLHGIRPEEAVKRLDAIMVLGNWDKPLNENGVDKWDEQDTGEGVMSESIPSPTPRPGVTTGPEQSTKMAMDFLDGTVSQ